MKVKWTEVKNIREIPEQYWGEDLSQFDHEREGTVLGTTKSFWGTTYLVVACNDGKVREVEISLVKYETVSC
jgi:hypothetical protein